jgi:hypothetical protein
MRWAALSRVGILAISGSLGVALGQGSGQGIEVDVRRALATSFPVDDPDVAAISLKLDLRLTNRSQETVYLPKAGAADGPEQRITVVNFEAKPADGAWAVLMHASWYGPAATRYAPCTSLPPGGSADFTDVPDRLVLLKARLAGLGGEPTVRLGLWLFCKQPDGKTSITDATTREFKLRLPAQR